MLFDEKTTSFLRPSRLLYELLVLTELDKIGTLRWEETGSQEGLQSLIAAGFLEQLAEQGWVEDIGTWPHSRLYQLTEAGRRRIRFLLVDYFHELLKRYDIARSIFRRRLSQLYAEGSRRIAFYAASESAEVAYSALENTGLELVAIIDDNPDKWGTMFCAHKVQAPDRVFNQGVDTVLITTVAFQDQIYERIKDWEDRGLRVRKFIA